MNFESVSYKNYFHGKLRCPLTQILNRCHNPLTANDNFFNSESGSDINFYSDIFPLVTKYFNPDKIRKGFEYLCKNINIRSINKNFETFKPFYSKLNYTFSIICFSETWATINSICNESSFQIENYTVLHQVRESGRRGGLSIFVHKEVYFKPHKDLS